MLDRQVQQGTQRADDVLARESRAQPAGVDLKPVAEVHERVAGDDRRVALDPEDHVVELLPREGAMSVSIALGGGIGSNSSNRSPSSIA
jgi:hypothetical protein